MSARNILDADMGTVGRWIAGGLRAWADELGELLPARIRSGSGARDRGPAARFDLDRGIAMLDGRPPRPGTRAAVLVPRHLCLLRVVERPAVPRRDLHRLLLLDRERIMPFSGEGAVVGGRVVEAQPATGRALVEVAGLPPAAARALADAIVGAALRPAAILVERVPGDDGPPIDLLPALQEAGLVSTDRGNARGWWAVVAFLFAANGGALVWRDQADVDRLALLVEEQRPAVATARVIAARIGRTDRLAAAVRAQRAQREPMLLLGAVGAALPSGARVKRFVLEGSELRLSGTAPRGVDVTGPLRRMPGVAELREEDGSGDGLGSPASPPFDVTMLLGGR